MLEMTGLVSEELCCMECSVCCIRQITTLEILAISMGLSTFQELLKGRKVVVWSDNKGAEGATRKGSAKAWDHCRLVHELWLHALQNRTHVWMERVASHDNISDSPSRWELAGWLVRWLIVMLRQSGVHMS